jgi:hypothetical protein
VPGPSVQVYQPADVTPGPRSSQWQRDPGIRELIRYFNQPERRGNWTAIKKKELEIISQEIKRCQEDFVYFAKNYVWITDKSNRDILFSLWEGQELILEKILWMKSRGMAQKLILIKARQLGASTVVEALIAWHVMFFPNRNALVVADVQKPRAEYLFGIMLHIYDMMPWWMQPMYSSKKYDTGLHFQNPDDKQRSTNPGLNSRVMVQAATSPTGIGMGIRLSAAHVSEFAAYAEERAKEIIESELNYALPRNADTFAVLESTAKGSGTYAERLWNANVELAENADWYPLFLPWFFEKTRFIAPEKGWVVQKPELDMRERIKDEWLICDNSDCEQYRESIFRGEPLVGTTCPLCGKGTLIPVVLSDGKLRFMWQERVNKERRGPDELKELRQELSSTPEEAFKLSGVQIFPQECHDYVNSTIRNPLAVGKLDTQGNFHGIDWTKAIESVEYYPCYCKGCNANHKYDDDLYLKIWEFPEPGRNYVLGGDVAEGVEQDYSVGWVNRIRQHPQEHDVHVATWRSNKVDAWKFAEVLNFLGRWYNTALMSIEYNYPTTADAVKNYYVYENLYIWKHPDNRAGMMSNKYHWLTQFNSKPKLWQTAVRWLKAGIWDVHDREFAYEMKRFHKEEYDSRSASAEEGFHDDVIIAAMIALFTSHDMDWDDATQSIPIAQDVKSADGAPWRMYCSRCKTEWGATNPTDFKECVNPDCKNIMLRAHRQFDDSLEKAHVDFNDMLDACTEQEIASGDLPYDAL